MLKVLVSYCIVYIIEETALLSVEITVICCNLVGNFFAESAYIKRCPSSTSKNCITWSNYQWTNF